MSALTGPGMKLGSGGCGRRWSCLKLGAARSCVCFRRLSRVRAVTTRGRKCSGFHARISRRAEPAGKSTNTFRSREEHQVSWIIFGGDCHNNNIIVCLHFSLLKSGRGWATRPATHCISPVACSLPPGGCKAKCYRGFVVFLEAQGTYG